MSPISSLKETASRLFDVFRFEGVGHSQGWEILNGSERRPPQDTETPEARGRPPAIIAEDIHAVEELLKEHGSWAREMTWDQLAREALNREVKGSTLRTHMHVMDYHRCIACTRRWVSKDLAQRRYDFAVRSLELRPEPEDWLDVAFSDEVHCGWGPTGKPRVIRRPGERLCKDCIRQEEEPHDKDKKRVHSWVAAHSKWKYDFVLYDAGNSNGKMTSDCYVNQILKPVVKPWLEQVAQGRLDPFTLEEEREGAYGIGRDSKVRHFKKEIGLTYYFNERGSPDLAPLENCWMPLKQHRQELALADWHLNGGMRFKSQGECAAAHNINVSLFSRRLRGTNESPWAGQEHLFILSEAGRIALTAQLMHLAKHGLPATNETILRAVRDHLHKTGRSTDVYSRCLEASRARKKHDPATIQSCFDLVKTTVDAYNITPENIYNLTETGFLTSMLAHTKWVIVEQKPLSEERMSEACLTDPPNREWVTVVQDVNAAGWHVAPLVITKGFCVTSDYGWGNPSTAAPWLQRFAIETAPPCGEDELPPYRLLVIDSHSSHAFVDFITTVVGAGICVRPPGSKGEECLR
ncbi:hypothetical protein Q7P37_002481 [Cladosporium fusiforme]